MGKWVITHRSGIVTLLETGKGPTCKYAIPTKIYLAWAVWASQTNLLANRIIQAPSGRRWATGFECRASGRDLIFFPKACLFGMDRTDDRHLSWQMVANMGVCLCNFLILNQKWPATLFSSLELRGKGLLFKIVQQNNVSVTSVSVYYFVLLSPFCPLLFFLFAVNKTSQGQKKPAMLPRNSALL